MSAINAAGGGSGGASFPAGAYGQALFQADILPRYGFFADGLTVPPFGTPVHLGDIHLSAGVNTLVTGADAPAGGTIVVIGVVGGGGNFITAASDTPNGAYTLGSHSDGNVSFYYKPNIAHLANGSNISITAGGSGACSVVYIPNCAGGLDAFTLKDDSAGSAPSPSQILATPTLAAFGEFMLLVGGLVSATDATMLPSNANIPVISQFAAGGGDSTILVCGFPTMSKDPFDWQFKWTSGANRFNDLAAIAFKP